MTHRYTITAARQADLGRLSAIELAAARLLSGHAPESVLSETTSLHELMAAQRQGHLWVALADDVPVGFAYVKLLEADSAHLQEIDVHPGHARRGLGARLIAAVLAWAAAAGHGAVTLTTFRDVPWNMRFYARLGFEVVPIDALSPALAAVVRDEAHRGLDPDRRVVMRYQVAAACTGDTSRRGEEAVAHDVQFLEEQINEYNFATTGIRDARALAIVLRDSAGRIYAGLSGHTWGGVAEIRLLWVEESRRRSGIGAALLHAAEAEACSRGCRKIVLSTHSFQAPDFYRQHGYVVAGEFADYPRGHSSIFLEKPLLSGLSPIRA